MIEAKLQLYEYNIKNGKPFYKKFDTKKKMYEWTSDQNEYPWLEIRILNFKELK